MSSETQPITAVSHWTSETNQRGITNRNRLLQSERCQEGWCFLWSELTSDSVLPVTSNYRFTVFASTVACFSSLLASKFEYVFWLFLSLEGLCYRGTCLCLSNYFFYVSDLFLFSGIAFIFNLLSRIIKVSSSFQCAAFLAVRIFLNFQGLFFFFFSTSTPLPRGIHYWQYSLSNVFFLPPCLPSTVF